MGTAGLGRRGSPCDTPRGSASVPLMAGGAAPRAALELHPADSPRPLESPPSRRVRGRPWPLGGARGSQADPPIVSTESPAGRGRRVESAERSAQAPLPPPRPVGTKGARPRRAGESGGPGGADRGARDGPGSSPAALRGSGGPSGPGRERWGRGNPRWPPWARSGSARSPRASPVCEPGARR